MENTQLADAPKRGFFTLVDFVVDPVLGVLDDIGATILLFVRAATWLVRPPFRVAQFLLAIEFIGAGSLFIAGLVGVFTGMAFTISTIVGFRQFSAEGMVGGVVALALARELAPVLAAVVVTARAGSTMASELGNMRVTEQIDAITTMGVSPIQYLVVPRVIASVLVLPCLCILFTIVAMVGAYGVAVTGLGVDPGVFMDRVRQLVEPRDLWMGLVKSAVFGFIIAIISCKQGFYANGGAKGVGIATTRAVVQSAVAILVANYIITSMMTEL